MEHKNPCNTCILSDIWASSCAEREAYEIAVAEAQDNAREAHVDLDALADAIDEASIRTHTILVIKRRRSFDVKSDDDSKVELNEGYDFDVDAPIAEIADGLAKMAIEMDKMIDLGEEAGGAFIQLIAEFYKKLKGGE